MSRIADALVTRWQPFGWMGPITRRPAALLALACAVAVISTPRAASAQALGVHGAQFTVDGHAAFLVFVSYFHGLDRPPAVMEADLDWLRSQGVRGIRVWPNVSRPPLMRADGELHAQQLERLRALVAAASARQMVVDVTFTREQVADDVTLAGYEASVVAGARALQPFRNVLFDLQNEWNCKRDAHGLTRSALQSMRAAIATVNPALLVTASNSCHPYARAGAEAFDILAYHGPRDRAGAWARETDALVAMLRAQLVESGRGDVPIYLQEPNPFPYPFDRETYYDPEPAHYVDSADQARRAGAAAWTFHTAAAFNLSSDTPLAHLLLPAERQVLERLAQRGIPQRDVTP